MRRIGIAGTNWTGKTTLAQALAGHYRDRHVVVVPLRDLVKKCPYPMLDKQTMDGSHWMVEQLRELLAKSSPVDVEVFDRCPVDVMAYTIHAGGNLMSDNIFQDLRELNQRFDRVYWLRPGEKWPMGGVRDDSRLEFARRMDGLMAQAIERLDLGVVVLPDDHDARLEAVRSFIDG